MQRIKSILAYLQDLYQNDTSFEPYIGGLAGLLLKILILVVSVLTLTIGMMLIAGFI